MWISQLHCHRRISQLSTRSFVILFSSYMIYQIALGNSTDELYTGSLYHVVSIAPHDKIRTVTLLHHCFLPSPFRPAILEPYFHLTLCHLQSSSQEDPIVCAQVLLGREFSLQAEHLSSGKGGTGLLLFTTVIVKVARGHGKDRIS